MNPDLTDKSIFLKNILFSSYYYFIITLINTEKKFGFRGILVLSVQTKTGSGFNLSEIPEFFGTYEFHLHFMDLTYLQ